ncbi:hypothetical protein BLNAU_25212 [Blattamonas nauphoetae]|uniref:Uncharacterized protein n=1 Tax=Blattamonas nauphoetae TaxID=2049346 RepID=A0ABQ9WP94_9EUKA|nr:hypothetical protein BLNAU_25212 [Blattamonas nauphoetae]
MGQRNLNPSHRISSAELVRTNRLQSVLGPETPLSRFVTQDHETTRNKLEEHKRTQELLRHQDQHTIQRLELELKTRNRNHRSYGKRVGRIEIEPAPTSSSASTSFEWTRQGTVVRSQIGAAAIELFYQTMWKSSLVSFEFGAEVARLSLIIRKGPNYSFILESSRPVWAARALTDYFPKLKGGAGWDLYPDFRRARQNWKDTNYGSACLEGREGQRVVLEADGREGKRTLKLSQDYEPNQCSLTSE